MNIHLVVINALDGGGNPVVIRRSTGRGYRTGPAESPANAKWLPGVSIPYQVTRDLFCKDMQSSRASYGEIVILNDRGELDYLKGYAFDGQIAEVWRGDDAAPFAMFVKVFCGVIKDVAFGLSKIAFSIRDRQEELAKPLPIPKYQGTNNGTTILIEGDSSLAGKTKPFALGTAKNVPGILVNATSKIYQVHYRQVQDITGCKTNGIYITKGADYADETALKNASITAGTCGTCKAKGLALPNVTSDMNVTFDVQGDAVGGYVSDMAGCARRIMDIAGWVAGTNYDTVSLAALAAKVAGQVELWDADGKNASELIDTVMAAGWGWWDPGRLGLTLFGRIEAAGGSPVVSLREYQIQELDLVQHDLAGLPWSLVTLAWGWNYMVMSGQAVASGAADADRAWLAEQSRTAYSTSDGLPDPTVLARHPLAAQMAFTGHFVSQADATAEAQRRAALRAAVRLAFKFKIHTDFAWPLNLGSVISLTHSRFSLAGWLGMVVSMNEVPENEYVEVTACA